MPKSTSQILFSEVTVVENSDLGGLNMLKTCFCFKTDFTFSTSCLWVIFDITLTRYAVFSLLGKPELQYSFCFSHKFYLWDSFCIWEFQCLRDWVCSSKYQQHNLHCDNTKRAEHLSFPLKNSLLNALPDCQHSRISFFKIWKYIEKSGHRTHLSQESSGCCCMWYILCMFSENIKKLSITVKSFD